MILGDGTLGGEHLIDAHIFRAHLVRHTRVITCHSLSIRHYLGILVLGGQRRNVSLWLTHGLVPHLLVYKNRSFRNSLALAARGTIVVADLGCLGEVLASMDLTIAHLVTYLALAILNHIYVLGPCFLVMSSFLPLH